MSSTIPGLLPLDKDSFWSQLTHFCAMSSVLYAKKKSFKSEGGLAMSVEQAYTAALQWLVEQTQTTTKKYSVTFSDNKCLIGNDADSSLYLVPQKCAAMKPGNGCSKRAGYVEICNRPMQEGTNQSKEWRGKTLRLERYCPNTSLLRTDKVDVIQQGLKLLLLEWQKVFVTKENALTFPFITAVTPAPENDLCKDMNEVDVTVSVALTDDNGEKMRTFQAMADDVVGKVPSMMSKHFFRSVVENVQTGRSSDVATPCLTLSFRIKFSSWICILQNKNARIQVPRLAKNMILVCNVSLRECESLLSAILSLRLKPIPGGVFIAPVSMDMSSGDTLNLSQPVTLWISYLSTVEQKFVYDELSKLKRDELQLKVPSYSCIFCLDADQECIAYTSKVMYGCDIHYRCNQAFVHLPWFCLMSSTPCFSENMGTLGGCTNPYHYRRNDAGWCYVTSNDKYSPLKMLRDHYASVSQFDISITNLSRFFEDVYKSAISMCVGGCFPTVRTNGAPNFLLAYQCKTYGSRVKMPPFLNMMFHQCKIMAQVFQNVYEVPLPPSMLPDDPGHDAAKDELAYNDGSIDWGKTIRDELEISGLSYGDVLTMQTAKRSVKRGFAEVSEDVEVSKDPVSIFGKPRAPFTWVCALCRTFKSEDKDVVQKHEKMCKDVMK